MIVNKIIYQLDSEGSVIAAKEELDTYFYRGPIVCSEQMAGDVRNLVQYLLENEPDKFTVVGEVACLEDLVLAVIFPDTGYGVAHLLNGSTFWVKLEGGVVMKVVDMTPEKASPCWVFWQKARTPA